ncbi:hypothetical protein CLF_101836 [Clonorchis sinensis]|uniref:Fibronectin type-III domain-containing protein n=1 Tax=Clonorchis sinensis TaxID=79923 RepID=G7Y6N9_CLOSI|nr:hypothetical protein CLF_101836 [Clonorchis sinensis]
MPYTVDFECNVSISNQWFLFAKPSNPECMTPTQTCSLLILVPLGASSVTKRVRSELKISFCRRLDRLITGYTTRYYSCSFQYICLQCKECSVRVTTVANSSTVSVTWRDNPDCDIDGYLVRIYAKDWSLVKMLETTNQQANILDVPTAIYVLLGSKLHEIRQTYSYSYRFDFHGKHKMLETTNQQANIPDVPTCVPLVVGVQGHNRAGNGSESRSTEFIIQSVPAIPKAVRVTSTSEPQAVDVTWQYESLCNAHIFRIDLHTTSGLSFKPLESRGRRRRITDLPTCVNMYASVRGRNEFGFGMQKDSSEFVIQAGIRMVKQKTKNLTPSAGTSPEYRHGFSVTRVFYKRNV